MDIHTLHHKRQNQQRLPGTSSAVKSDRKNILSRFVTLYGFILCTAFSFTNDRLKCLENRRLGDKLMGIYNCLGGAMYLSSFSPQKFNFQHFITDKK